MAKIEKLDKQITRKIKDFDTKLKTSFILIRQDLDDMQITLDAMKNYLKKKDDSYEKQNKYNIKAQSKINEKIEEFTEKTTKLKLALSQMNAIKSEVVLRKDLSKIEKRIKDSFSREVEKYKSETISLKQSLKESNKRIKQLEKGLPGKKSWFSKN